MKLQAKVFLNEQDVLSALAAWVRQQYPELLESHLVVESKVTKGRYSAVIETKGGV